MSKILNINRSKESGQVFVGIVIVMLIALTLGVTVSTRFMSTLRMNTQADELTRALGVAEAGIERILLQPNDVLDGFIQFNNCGSACVVEITDPNGKVLRADISLSYAGNSSEPYVIQLNPGDVAQVSLAGYPSNMTVSVCWDTGASIYASYIHRDGSNVPRADAYAYNSASSAYYDNNFSTATGNYGHSSCFSVNTVNSPYMLRLKGMYTQNVVYVIPSAGQVLPKQGILIQSTGVAGDARKTVRVVKTDAVMPEAFDYLLFQKAVDYPLSNATN